MYALKGRVSSVKIVSQLYIVQALMGSFQLNFVPTELKKPIGVSFFVALCFMIVLSYWVQTLSTRATLLMKPSILMPFNYVGIIASFMVDILLYHASFDFYSIIGMLLTSAGLLSRLFIKT